MESVGKQFGKDTLTGMPEGCVAEIMAKGNRLGEIFVQLQSPGHGPGDLADFKGVGKTRAVVISLRRKKNLSFIFEPAESLAVQNPIAVNLENRAHRTGIFGNAISLWRLCCDWRIDRAHWLRKSR